MAHETEEGRFLRDDWFSARLKSVCFIEGVGSVDSDLCAHVFRATDWDDAFRRALQIGNDPNHTARYLNGDGDKVEWRFAAILTLDNLGNADLDGREVHSLLTGDEEGLPFETVYRPEKSEAGETGVPFLNVE